MGTVNSLIASRLKSKEPSQKMEQMAKKSAEGGLSSFNGLFHVVELSFAEKTHLEKLLTSYAKNPQGIQEDLKTLMALTSEIKAINHQAALLHGERIKKAQILLIHYEEGAFTAWLIATYGNRQTPYNLMQYYEFYHALPLSLRSRAEEMPRQALYTLASRKAEMEQKIHFLTNYQGETKGELLLKIRNQFPLQERDRRRENRGDAAISGLQKIHALLKNSRVTRQQKETLIELLSEIHAILR